MPRGKKQEVVDETVSLALALRDLCEEKGLPENVVKDAIADALRKAYFKFSGDYSDTIVNVEIDLDAGSIEMYKVKNVVEEIQDDVFETDPEEAYEETGIRYNVGDTIKTPIDISKFRRAAAMQAKNVFKQKLREAEKAVVVQKYQNKVGYLLTGIVDVVETKHCIVKIGGRTNAYLNKSNMLPGESFTKGQIVKVYVEEVDKAAAGAPIIVSRTNPKFVTRLMEEEISEIKDGIVEIKGVSRQPGSRSKVAVYSKDPNIDPSGACIGPKGTRIARVISQLNGEKIDVVNYDENPLLFVADSLKPAEAIGIEMLDEENKAVRAIVPDEQFSLAIGKDAQNVNLAVRLTGYKIDIKSVSDAEENNYTYQSVEDIKLVEGAKRQRTISITPRKVDYYDEEEIPSTPTIVDETIKAEPQVKVEETPKVVKEEPKVTPTRPVKTKATANVFSELEAALNATPVVEEQKPQKKKKKTNKEEDDFVVEEELPAKKKAPAAVLPVYTEEELRALEEEEEAEDSKYDEDIDYDEFDEYYDDED